MNLWVTTAELARATGKAKNTIRAKVRNCESRTITARGGAVVEFNILSLPEDLRDAVVASSTSIEPSSVEIVATRDALPRGIGIATIPGHARETLFARSLVLALWRDSGLSIRKFKDTYRDIAQKELLNAIPTVSVSTLQRWKTARNYADVNLAPKRSGKRGRRALSGKEQAVLASLYLSPNKPTAAWVYGEFKKIFPERTVSYDTALRYLSQDIPPSVVIKLREGEKAYNDKVLSYIERDYTRIRPMENWFSDHHMLDLVVTDGYRIFRPWVTAWQDQRSRKIVGWVISIQPCTATIMASLRQGIERYGAPHNATMDNGKDYLSHALNGKGVWVTVRAKGVSKEEFVRLRGTFETLGIAVHHTQVYHGQSKPIERWFRTLCEAFSKRYETYAGSNTSDKPDTVGLYYRRIGDAAKRDVVLTLTEVEENFRAWVNEWNATHEHQGQGMNGRTPDEVFEEHPLPARCISSDALDITFTKAKTARVARNGVRFEGLLYYADEFAGMVGKAVILRRPYNDVGKLLVYSIENETYLCTAHNGSLRDLGIASDNLARLKKINRRKRETASQYQKDMLENLQSLSIEEKLALEAAQPRRGSGVPRVVPSPDLSPAPIQRVIPGIKKLALKTGIEIYDTAYQEEAHEI